MRRAGPRDCQSRLGIGREPSSRQGRSGRRRQSRLGRSGSARAPGQRLGVEALGSSSSDSIAAGGASASPPEPWRARPARCRHRTPTLGAGRHRGAGLPRCGCARASVGAPPAARGPDAPQATLGATGAGSPGRSQIGCGGALLGHHHVDHVLVELHRVADARRGRGGRNPRWRTRCAAWRNRTSRPASDCSMVRSVTRTQGMEWARRLTMPEMRMMRVSVTT